MLPSVVVSGFSRTSIVRLKADTTLPGQDVDPLLTTLRSGLSKVNAGNMIEPLKTPEKSAAATIFTLGTPSSSWSLTEG